MQFLTAEGASTLDSSRATARDSIDQAHGLECQRIECAPFFLKIFNRVFLIDAVALEEAIQLDATEAKHFAQLALIDAVGAELVDGAVLEFFVSRFAAQLGDQFVGDVDGEIRKSTPPEAQGRLDAKRPATACRGPFLAGLDWAVRRSSCRVVPSRAPCG